mmetsp:Transcript_26068/g.69536  ORF Transcript_26068/g.69536 Transcript_26068/m.69536 type:complete len:172 (-) Transcript_26068:197-712(-)
MQPCTAGEACRKIHLIDADQSKHSHLQRVVVESLGGLSFSLDMASSSWAGTGYGVVIDDGSHVPRHMLLTFQTLWPYVRPGGVYVLEDIGYSYSDCLARSMVTPSAMGVLASLPQAIWSRSSSSWRTSLPARGACHVRTLLCSHRRWIAQFGVYNSSRGWLLCRSKRQISR